MDRPITRMEFARYLLCVPLYIMLTLMVIEAALSATTTWLVIKAGRDVAGNTFHVMDLVWIAIVQSTSYLVGAMSWMFAEQAGFRAFGRYMFRFARDNRSQTKLLHDKPQREQVEPFLTSETFYTTFQFMYEMESQLKVLLSLIFNAAVLGAAIDPSLPVAYLAVFVALMALQWSLRKRVAFIYLENQRHNNRVTAQGYTAWDNIFAGNPYNRHLWFVGFKTKLRECLRAQIRAILTREGLSSIGGILGLAIIFTTMAGIVLRESGDTAVLIALAATLPRQIEMTNEVHELASGWNDVLAIWTRVGGIVHNMRPTSDPYYDTRIKFERLYLRDGEQAHEVASVQDALQLVTAAPTGRINVRGTNGAGKSTLLTALKSELKKHAFYWPTSDRLAFRFLTEVPEVADDDGDEDAPAPPKPPGFSSGERQIRSLREIVEHTDAAIYLLDEWDANLDPNNRAIADALVVQLATRARVVEVSHRDRT